MIARLRGTVDSIGDDCAVIDVGGVGYLVSCSGKTLGKLPAVGGAVRLLIETHVREDQIALYGFFDESERNWFRILLTVSGVGARLALALQSVLTPTELAGAIVSGDKTMLCRANGVGAKLAARLITELKDKAAAVALVPGFAGAAGAEATGSGGSMAGSAPLASGALEDAISALVNLGYRRFEAHAAVTKAAQTLGEDAEASRLIGAGLKLLGKDLIR